MFKSVLMLKMLLHCSLVFWFAWLLLLWAPLCTGKGGGGGGDEEEVGKVTIAQSPETVVLGASVKFTCSFPTIADARTLYWFKFDDILYANTGQQVIHAGAQKHRVEVTPGQDFTTSRQHVLSVKNAEISDDGKYRCMITRSEAHDFVADEGEIELSISPDSVSVEASVPANLTCAGSSSEGLLYWIKDNYFIVINGTMKNDVSSGYDMFGNTLSIKNVTSSYEGQYTCYRGGRRVHSWAVSIIRPPLITLSPLREWRGILFGVALAVLIVGTLGIAFFIQNKHPDSVKI